MATTTAKALGGLRYIARPATLILGCTGLTVLGAKIAIPLPWTPVPATLQVAAVIFAGSACGARWGALSQLLYLALGLLGLPVFADSAVSGPTVAMAPTFGYLLSFPAAAYLAGRWSGPVGRWLAGVAGLGCIYLAGMVGLLVWAQVQGRTLSVTWVLVAGLLPFLPFDLLKTALAVWSSGPLHRWLRC